MSPIATPATADLMGTPASISASEPAQTVAMLDEPFDSSTSETTLMVYGKTSSVGIIGSIARSASIAVTDLAPARTPDGPDLTDREGREVVVEHEALPRLALERVDLLLVAGRAERH